MKIYVATKAELVTPARLTMSIFEKAGHTITRDWTRVLGQTRENAEGDLQGVIDCDVYIGLFGENVAYKGTYVEFGAALVLGKRVIVVGRVLQNCIFFQHPRVERVETVDQALALVGFGG